MRATWRTDAGQIWIGAASGVVTGITSLIEGWGVAVSFFLALGAAAFALAIFVLIARNDLLDWIGSIFGSEHARQTRILARIPKEERALEQKRMIIADAYGLIDKVARQIMQADQAGELIRRHSAYYRIEQDLSEEARNVVHAISGTQTRPALTIKGEETGNDRLLRILRQEIARLERQWELV